MPLDTHNPQDPHADQPLLMAGEPLATASSAMLLVHGRGASAANILELADELPHPGMVYLAPQAAGNTWYPYSFLQPIERNEPGLSSALARLGSLLEQLAAAGIPPDRTVLLGFSQGACLVSEFTARNARRYAGVVCLSGGLIGPNNTPRDYQGTLSGTPILLGCSDVDPHIPKERVHESAAVLRSMGGNVTERLYPGMGHTVNQDEIDWLQALLQSL